MKSPENGNSQGFGILLVVRQHIRVTLLYGNNKQCQIKESGREERGAKAGIYPASTLSL